MGNLNHKYNAARQRAILLMKYGKLSAYFAQLVKVHELQLQLLNFSAMQKK